MKGNERRAGEATLDGRRLALVSEHRVEGPDPGAETASPIGDRVGADGRTTGMVTRNGTRRIAPPRDPAARDAALALALFRDPADL